MAAAEVVAVQTALPPEEKVAETDKDTEIESPPTLDDQQVAAPETQPGSQEKPNPSDDDPAETKEEVIKDNNADDDAEETRAALEKLELEKKTDDNPPPAQESSKVTPEPQTEMAEGDKEVTVVESEPEKDAAGAASDSAETETSVVAPKHTASCIG